MREQQTAEWKIDQQSTSTVWYKFCVHQAWMHSGIANVTDLTVNHIITSWYDLPITGEWLSRQRPTQYIIGHSVDQSIQATSCTSDNQKHKMQAIWQKC